MPATHSNRIQKTLDRIVRALAGLHFGSVEISVHHGRIVQIERREKLRLDEPHPGRAERVPANSDLTS